MSSRNIPDDEFVAVAAQGAESDARGTSIVSPGAPRVGSTFREYRTNRLSLRNCFSYRCQLAKARPTVQITTISSTAMLAGMRVLNTDGGEAIHGTYRWNSHNTNP